MSHGEAGSVPPPVDSKQMVDNIGESIRTYLERASRKKDKNVWPSSWIGVLSVIGRARRHLHLGLPVEHRPLLHTPCPKQAPPQAPSQRRTHQHPSAGRTTDRRIRSNPRHSATAGRNRNQQSPNTVTPQAKVQSQMLFAANREHEQHKRDGD